MPGYPPHSPAFQCVSPCPSISPIADPSPVGTLGHTRYQTDSHSLPASTDAKAGCGNLRSRLNLAAADRLGNALSAAALWRILTNYRVVRLPPTRHKLNIVSATRSELLHSGPRRYRATPCCRSAPSCAAESLDNTLARQSCRDRRRIFAISAGDCGEPAETVGAFSQSASLLDPRCDGLYLS